MVADGLLELRLSMPKIEPEANVPRPVLTAKLSSSPTSMTSCHTEDLYISNLKSTNDGGLKCVHLAQSYF